MMARYISLLYEDLTRLHTFYKKLLLVFFSLLVPWFFFFLLCFCTAILEIDDFCKLMITDHVSFLFLERDGCGLDGLDLSQTEKKDGKSRP